MRRAGAEHDGYPSDSARGSYDSPAPARDGCEVIDGVGTPMECLNGLIVYHNLYYPVPHSGTWSKTDDVRNRGELAAD